MDAFSPGQLAREIERLSPPGTSGCLCVALSGGLDSVVLLEALARCDHVDGRWPLRVLHVDHGLHADSSAWELACAQRCARLGVPYESLRVAVPRVAGDSLEAAARVARYEALAQRLGTGEILLTAHHADDQLETLLLALIRGSGLAGLAAMPAVVPFARGWHARPLLTFPRAALAAWARSAGVDWLEDPANRDVRFDRNYLRLSVVPELRARWPGVAASIARTTRHLGEALSLLDELAVRDLRQVGCGPCLDLVSLSALPPARRRNVLRFWLRLRDVPAPATRVLAALEHDMLLSAADRCPSINWPGAELRRHRGLLYAMQPLDPPPRSTEMEWHWQEPASLPAGLGRLRVASCPEGSLAAERLPRTLRIRFRAGGERLHVAGRTQRRALKKWLQELDVLPWYRGRMPLVYAGESLVAVADQLIAHEFAARSGEASVSIVWDEAPAWRAERRHATRGGSDQGGGG